MVAPTTAPIAKLGHVAIETPDLEESLWFFCDLMGFKETERVGNTSYLRGIRDWEHHTLSITETGEQGVDHIGWRASTKDAVDELASTLESDGIELKWIDAGTEPGVGEAFRFISPHGHPYEVYFDVERPPAEEGKRSRLENRRYSPQFNNPVAPQRIDHVHVQGPSGWEQIQWHMDTFGMGLNEIFENADGEEWGWWISSTPLPHDIAVHNDEETDVSLFHHFSFHVNRLDNIWDAADILAEHRLPVDAGPGKHAITLMDFLYVKDPASGVRLELVNGPGYLNFESDWDPLVWKEDEIGTEEDHQWIGQQYSLDAVPYAGDFLD